MRILGFEVLPLRSPSVVAVSHHPSPKSPCHPFTPPMPDDRNPATAPRIIPKPWGREIWYAHQAAYAGKILEVNQGHALSLQKHERKHETMYLQSGRLLFHLDGVEFELTPGECLTIRPGQIHRLTALEDSVILEVSTPELDDVIRLEDRYGRQVAG